MKMSKYLTREDCFDTTSEYYSQMIKIIEANSHFPKKVCKDRELHHIILKSFSKKSNAEIDNRLENLVSLSREDHFLIHYFSWKCANKKYVKSAAYAVSLMRRSLLTKDTAKNDFLNIMIADISSLSKTLFTFNKQSFKRKKHTNTFSWIDLVLANVLVAISNNELLISDFFEKMGVTGHTHSFSRYVNNAKAEYPLITENFTNSLTQVVRSIFPPVKKFIKNNDALKAERLDTLIEISRFISWFICEYHMQEDLYDEKDTLEDVIEKYNNDNEIEDYLKYVENLKAKYGTHCYHKVGSWFNNGLSELRLIKNPDPNLWVKGRLPKEVNNKNAKITAE